MGIHSHPAFSVSRSHFVLMSSMDTLRMMIVFSLMGFFPSLEAKPPVDLGRVNLTPITSPNYPEKYGSNTDETFDRSVEEGSQILITFTDFDIEYHPYCRWDWVKVVDGDGTVLLNETCGSDKPDPITSKTNRITVEFHSDRTEEGTGFRAEVHVLQPAQFQPIVSPNYPEEYGNNMDETFDRSVEEGSQILITFTDFEIENHPNCGWDWVKVVDGDGTDLLRKSCGSGIPDPMTSKTNRITVEFHSDFSITRRGFKAELNAVPGSSSACKCGIPNRVHRIVGGTDTEVNEYPWQVKFTMCKPNGQCGWTCGGSLIDDRTVLTAAHCTKGYIIRKVTVGMHYQSTSIEGQEDIPVIRQIDHPHYYSDPKTGAEHNDSAILILGRTVQWTETVQPVCLPTDPTATYLNRMATTTGWGRLWSGGDVPDELQEVDVKVISNEKCAEMYPRTAIAKDMICAAEENGEGGKDACQGDSGGPLITERQGVTVDGKQQYEQVGVVSWGRYCADARYPGVYARVTEHLDWIKENMQGDTCSLTRIVNG